MKKECKYERSHWSQEGWDEMISFFTTSEGFRPEVRQRIEADLSKTGDEYKMISDVILDVGKKIRTSHATHVCDHGLVAGQRVDETRGMYQGKSETLQVRERLS